MQMQDHPKMKQKYRLKRKEVTSRCQKLGIPIDYHHQDGAFYSKKVKIQGREADDFRYDGGKFTREAKLENTYCPNCGSQGYRTDHPEVATCSAVPGWFFYYQEEEEKEEEKRKTKLIRTSTGEVVEVEVK